MLQKFWKSCFLFIFYEIFLDIQEVSTRLNSPIHICQILQINSTNVEKIKSKAKKRILFRNCKKFNEKNLQKDLQVALSSKFLTSYGSFENITFYNDSTPIYKTNDPMKSRHSKPVKMPLTLSTFSVQLATSKVVFIIDQFLSPYLSYFWEGYSR